MPEVVNERRPARRIYVPVPYNNVLASVNAQNRNFDRGRASDGTELCVAYFPNVAHASFHLAGTLQNAWRSNDLGVERRQS